MSTLIGYIPVLLKPLQGKAMSPLFLDDFLGRQKSLGWNMSWASDKSTSQGVAYDGCSETNNLDCILLRKVQSLEWLMTSLTKKDFIIMTSFNKALEMLEPLHECFSCHPLAFLSHSNRASWCFIHELVFHIFPRENHESRYVCLSCVYAAHYIENFFTWSLLNAWALTAKVGSGLRKDMSLQRLPYCHSELPFFFFTLIFKTVRKGHSFLPIRKRVLGPLYALVQTCEFQI